MKVPAPDKLAHALGGAVIACALILLIAGLSAVGWLRVPLPVAVGLSLAVVALVAAEKERRDARDPTRHTADLADFAATVGGGLLVVLPALALTLLR